MAARRRATSRRQDRAARTSGPMADRGPTPIAASFRDPSGFVFRHDGRLLRQVNPAYAADYDALVASGLLRELTDLGLLVAHDEVVPPPGADPRAHRFLAPREVPEISYPYEWCFSQLKDAALLTLELAERALQHDLVLKDASAYNVQFVAGGPLFIDTLSFERYAEGRPWVAYQQFCRHFLAPLALMARVDVRLGLLAREHVAGVPLDLAARLMPWRTRLSPGLLMHLHLHAGAQRRHADDPSALAARAPRVSRFQLRALFDSLKRTIAALEWRAGGTEWGDYYARNNNYGDAGLQEKERLVGELLAGVAARRVWDLGGNTGRFSRVAAAGDASVVCWDIDPGCVEAHYRHNRAHGERRVLPLLQDLTNPSPGLGWDHAERDALAARAPVDAVLALGLVHHLAISNNLPLPRVVELFARLGRTLLIEWVPKDDSQVQKLLATRADVFPDYDQAGFEVALAAQFSVRRREPIAGTRRTLYLAERRA